MHDEDYDEEEGPSSSLMLLRIATVLLSLLPIPVLVWDLLPTYAVHARFLVFYAPLICFLVLGYVLYIREVLARIMFADVLDPSPDPYLDGGRLAGRRLRGALFALLPVALLGASLYSVTRYIARFNDSVAMASQVVATRIPMPAPADTVAPADSAAKPAGRAAPDSVARPQLSESEQQLAALRRMPDLEHDPNPLRTYTLVVATVDDIPYFAEMTAWFIAAIATALVGVLLVLVKEYARSTLRVSEGELLEGVRGQPLAGPELERAIPEQRSGS